MKKLFILTLICLGWCSSSYSQKGGVALGIRLSYGGLITGKYFYEEGKAVEGIFALRWSGIVFTGLLEWSHPLPETKDLQWFYGGGFHIGFHSADTEFDPNPDFNSKTYVHPGIDGIVGLEYVFSNIPASVAIDWKPAVAFTGSRRFIPEGIGFSLRYHLINQDRK